MKGNITHALREISPEATSAAASSRLEIRPIRSTAELDCVYRMTHDAYVDMGFIQPQPDGRLVHYPQLDVARETTILIAILDGVIVGTNSFTLDGPSGLHVDEDFKQETDRVRAEGRPLASGWRINTRRNVRDQANIVKSLIGETLRRQTALGVRTCLFIFNKRHERIYQRLLCMKTIAELPEIECVHNFPAVLMRCDFEHLPKWCSRYMDKDLVQEKERLAAELTTN